LKHQPCLVGDQGSVKCFYALATLKDGSVQIDAMSKNEVDAIRARSPAAKTGPWSSDFVEMGRKTILKRLLKTLPSVSELGAVDVEIESAEVPGGGTVDMGTGEIATPAGDRPQTQPAGQEPTLAEQRTAILKKVRELLMELSPGSDEPARQGRAALVLKFFGHTSWARLQSTPVDFLRPGLDALETKLARNTDPISEGDQVEDPIGGTNLDNESEHWNS